MIKKIIEARILHNCVEIVSLVLQPPQALLVGSLAWWMSFNNRESGIFLLESAVRSALCAFPDFFLFLTTT